MDMTNLKNGNGFVTKQDLFLRMARFKPPTGDYYSMRQIKGRDFSEVGVMAYGAAMMPLFKIYTGNRELYEYITRLVVSIATEMGYECRVKPYQERT
jgi:hypothetical protein